MVPPSNSSRTFLQWLLQRDVILSARLHGRVANPGFLAGLSRVVALLVAHSGDSPIWLAGALAAILWGRPPWPSFGRRALAATLVGGVVAMLLKWLFRRRRPGGPAGGLYTWLDRHAFPSGHATRAACVAVVLAPLLPAWGVGLLTVWSCLVSLARVALGVHYLLDVIVGLAVGLLSGLGLLLARF